MRLCSLEIAVAHVPRVSFDPRELPSQNCHADSSAEEISVTAGIASRPLAEPFVG